jgi:ion channel
VAERNLEDLPRHRRYALVLVMSGRAVVIGVCLVLAYYLLPMDRPFTVGTLAGLAVGLALVVGLLAWQTVEITRSPHPRLRAVEAVTTVFSLFILLFSTAYFLMERNAAGTFNEALTRTDALYFTVTTFATVGYGDIVPVGQEARVTVLVQMLGDLLLIGVALKVILGAVQAGLQRGRGLPFPNGGIGQAMSGGRTEAEPREKPESGE